MFPNLKRVKRVSTGGAVQAVRRFAKRFSVNTRGGVAITFASLLPVLLALGGMGADYGLAIVQRTTLQQAADAAALAAAKELNLVNTDERRLKSVAETVVRANLGEGGSGVSIETRVQEKPSAVVVNLTKNVEFLIMQHFGPSATKVKVEAVARVVGRTPICVLALNPNAGRSIFLERNARVTGNNCAIYANSRSRRAILALDKSRLEAELICSAGGTSGDPDTFAPQPLDDCPRIEDPLADRAPPPVGKCDYLLKIVAGGRQTLSPGTYCGGLQIQLGAMVKLRPGIYVMKGGPLTVDTGTTLTGENVGFYMEGLLASFIFGVNTTISLTAPEYGPMAGLLFFSDRNVPKLVRNEILSDDARVLLGTIYLPKGYIHIDANKPIADRSAYTAIVAQKLNLSAGPNLVLNTDYDTTTVPVPDGIGGSRRSIYLAR